MNKHLALAIVGASFISIAPVHAYTFTCPAGPVQCSTFAATGTSATSGAPNLSAAAQFAYDSTNQLLHITVVNDATSGPGMTGYHQQDLLGAIFFGTSSLTGLSASTNVAADTAIANKLIDEDGVVLTAAQTPCSSTTDVSCGYRFDSGLSGAPAGLKNGISSIGFGLFGSASNFSPDGGANIQGVNNGIPIAPVDFPAHDGINGNNPPYSALQYATFTLSVAGNFNLGMIDKVGFQYGSALTDPFLVVTPEPGFYGALALGLTGLCSVVLRKRKQSV